MRRHSLFRYFSERRWADAFVAGQLRFRSLAYFRDYENAEVRGDRNEGTSVYKPKEGLTINNQTQGKTSVVPYRFESTANQDEIFVYCLSRSLTNELRQRFKAVTCVEIIEVKEFCKRIEASLPKGASFPGKPRRMRIGQHVGYYREIDGRDRRWALPDVIATSKLDTYAWQDEYRLVFSLTDALDFEKVTTRLVRDGHIEPSPPQRQPTDYAVNAGSLADLARIHEWRTESGTL